MFRSAQNYRTFLVVLFTYTLDLLGYSIVFPVLAPLLLNPELQFFAAGTSEAVRTTVLGVLFALFGVAQLIGAPVAGALADHYGRYKIFLWTVGLSVVGYGLLAFSIYLEQLSWIFVGRIVTGFCSGNFALAQSATADLTEEHNRTKAFGLLIGIGGLGFVIGPWIGGILANPAWLSGAAAFIFACIAALINFFVLLFFFVETHRHSEEHKKVRFLDTFKDLKIVVHHKILRRQLTGMLLFCIGWAFFLIFFPTYLVQKFSMGSEMIGNMYAYSAITWVFISIFLNKELLGKFSLQTLVLTGLPIAAVGVALFTWPNTLWPYWILIPFATIGGSLAWVNANSLLSLQAPANLQGRAMGASGSVWSVGQVIAPLVAGPLAGWNMYSPLLIGSAFLFIAFFYCLVRVRER